MSGQMSEDQFRRKATGPGEVPCDVCTGPKLKAQKSCLVCLTSYCQTHLEPHSIAPGLKKHQLMDPVKNLEDRMCLKHNKHLELFCKTDQTFICVLCSVLDHKTHRFVSLREECEGKKDEVQQMIQNRRLKIQDIKQTLRISEAAADRETAEGLQVFTDLMDSVERNKKSFMKEMEDKQTTTKKQAEDFIKDLDQEISELNSEDHLHLLQSFRSLNVTPPTKNWTRVRVDPPSFEEFVVRAVAQLEEDLRRRMKKMESEAELKRVQRFEVDLTLDPKTAHPNLFLSADRKQVHHRDVKNEVPDNQERFSKCASVLGSQSFSSGRFYFQVQVKEKTDWTLGVTRKSISRKEHITASPLNGFWAIVLRNRNQYEAAADPAVDLSLQSGPEKVGVFVDYQEGLVSFYDVDAAALIYSFTGCCFTGHLCPFFSPDPNFRGRNSSPLIICPVSQSA